MLLRREFFYLSNVKKSLSRHLNWAISMLRNIDKARSVDLFKKLLRIPSSSGNEEQMSLFILDFFRDLGLPIILDRVDDKLFNIVSLIRGEKPVDSLLLVSPLDTFQETNNIEISSEYFIGSFDSVQKASLAAILSAIEHIVTTEFLPAKNVLFLGVVDTKREHRGMYEFIRSEIFPEMALITEPTNFKIKIGCTGQIFVSLTLEPQDDRTSHYEHNAINEMIKIIPSLLKSLHFSNDLRGVGTVDSKIILSSIQGIYQPYLQKNKCNLLFEILTIPGFSKSEVHRQIANFISKMFSTNSLAISFKLNEGLVNFKPVANRGLLPAFTDPTEQIVRLAINALERNNISPQLYFSFSYSEMDFLVNDLGVPTISLGIGSDAQIQKVSFDEYFNAVKIYIDIIKSIQ